MRIQSTTVLLIACLFTAGLTSLSSGSAAKPAVDTDNRRPRIIHVPRDHARIQAAIDAAKNRDTVLVAPGIYREHLRLQGKQITLASRFLTSRDEKDVRRTVLDGSPSQNKKTTRGKTLITVARDVGPGTRIIGFTIKNGDDGISCTAKIEISHNYFTNNGDAIDYESGGGICRANTFEKNGDDAVDLDGPTEAIIEDNVIRNNGDDGIEIRLHKYAGKMLNILIRRNLIIGSGEDGIQIIDYPDKSNRVIRIQRNVIADTRMAAIGCMANGNTRENYEAANIPERIEVINNTLIDNHYGITGGDSLLALNNVIAGTKMTALKQVDGNSVLAFNLLWNNTVDNQGSHLVANSTIARDPRLDGQYRPGSNSPCIDAGTSLYKKAGAVLLKIPRTSFIGKAPDLGAFELSR
ncbi:MAG: right-handed parallel beta-helix repeat-containing protein [Planctomycetaceae bacterium]|jgi:hypothetical protein|nr:right-handed parallel beta-helix repeat-containing protein [Planctomycetaceae bacterium]